MQKLVERTDYDQYMDIATYYGISPVDTPSFTAGIEKKTKNLQYGEAPYKYANKIQETLLTSYINEKATLVDLVHGAWAHLSKPVSIMYELPFKKEGVRKVPGASCYGIDIIGSANCIADATLIQTTKAILEEAGYKKLTLEVNCIGDRDAAARFERELVTYFRKHINTLSPEEQKILKGGVFHLLQYTKKSQALKDIIEEAPRAMSFLSEAGRDHFKKLLEHLEELDIDYTINGHLVDDRYSSNFTIFAFTNPAGTLLAIGSRYNNLGKKIGYRKDLSAVGARICFKNKKAVKKISADKVPQKCFYFMQLGPEAKLKSLRIIETLRKKKIPMCHSLTRDKASSQLGTAENLNVPFVLIMGKKEAHEETIAVRENVTRSQKVIPLRQLPTELGKLQKKHLTK